MVIGLNYFYLLVLISSWEMDQCLCVGVSIVLPGFILSLVTDVSHLQTEVQFFVQSLNTEILKVGILHPVYFGVIFQIICLLYGSYSKKQRKCIHSPSL